MMWPTFAPFPALELLGLYLPPLMLWAGLALVGFVALRWLLDRAGLYRFVWHRPLFNLALYVLLTGSLVFLGSHPWL